MRWVVSFLALIVMEKIGRIGDGEIDSGIDAKSWKDDPERKCVVDVYVPSDPLACFDAIMSVALCVN
jgi:hypothetical protein